jgi:RNA polymerase sigma factor (sigma-70 family)
MPVRTNSAIRLVRAAARAAGLGERTDTELLTDFLAGETVAFEALVRRHGSMVLRTCRAATRCEADAEDAFQATFVLLYRKAASVRDRRSVAGWLFRVARRSAGSARRAADRRDRREAAVGRPTAQPAADLSWREACAILHTEIDRLPDVYRLPLVLCHLQGLSRDEAAQHLGWSLNEVRGRLERGRTRLRQRLEKRDVALSAGLLGTVAVSPTLVRAAVTSVARPSASVGHIAAALSTMGRIQAATGFAVAAALVIAVGIGANGLRAGPTTQPKESPAKSEARAEPGAKNTNNDGPERLNVSGRVVDPDGKAMAGAKIWLLTEAEFRTRVPGESKVLATTDADGRFTITDEGKGRPRYWTGSARIVATADGFGPAWVGADADKPVELKLVRDEPIRGRLLTLEGKPVVGAKVRVREVAAPKDPDLSKLVADLRANEREWHVIFNSHFDYGKRLIHTGTSFPGQPAAAETDAEGRFRLTGLGRERLIELRVEGPTIASTELHILSRTLDALTVAENPGDRRFGTITYHGATFDFAVGPTEPFEGVVTDRGTGKPVAGVAIRGQNRRLEFETVTDRDGRYRLTGLPPGPHQLMAIPTPDQPFHRMVASGGRAASTDSATVDFALTRGTWVTGKVVNARTGQPEAGAPIWYHPIASEPAYEAVPGSQAWMHEATTVTAADGSFRVLAFRCRGAIVANSSMRQCIGADQRPLQGDADSLDRGMRSNTMIPTSPVVHLASYHAAAIVNVDANKPREYTITIDPGVTVSVKVVGPDGKPVAGAGVGGQSTWSLWSPDQKAEIELTQFNPDRPRPLLFLHSGKGIGKLVEPKAGEKGPMEVKLEPTGTATGRLITEDGRPVANAILDVHYRLPGHEAWTPSFAHREVRTDAKGWFRLPNLVAGVPYSARYQTQNGGARQDYHVNIQVKSGETKDLAEIKPVVSELGMR